MTSWKMNQFLREVTMLLSHGNLSFKRVVWRIEDLDFEEYEYRKELRLMFLAFGSSIGYHDGIWSYFIQECYDELGWEEACLQFQLQCTEMHLQQNYHQLYKGLKKIIRTMYNEQIMIESMSSFAKRVNLK